MAMLIFRTVDGQDIAILEEDITALWPEPKMSEHTRIACLSEEYAIVVVGDFNDILKDGFDRLDLRPKAEPIPIKKR